MLEQLQNLDINLLTPVVRQDQRSATFEITDWAVAPLSDKGVSNPDGLFLFNGHGQDHQGQRPWSVVLKALNDRGETLAPSHLWYWKRELLVNQSGFLSNLQGLVATPRCYGIVEREHDGWIWMEHIIARSNERWTLDGLCIGRAAGWPSQRGLSDPHAAAQRPVVLPGTYAGLGRAGRHLPLRRQPACSKRISSLAPEPGATLF